MTIAKVMFTVFGLSLVVPAAARCQDSESSQATAADRFQKAYEILLQADTARDANRSAEAASLYEAARDLHLRLIGDYPEWQPGVVKFRSAYCGDQLAHMRRSMGTGDPSPAPARAGGAPAGRPPERPSAELTGEARQAVRDLIREGRTEEARGLLLDTLREHPDNRDVRALLASTQCRAGDYTDAVHILQSLVREYPDDPIVRVILSTAYFGRGQVTNALAEINRALKLDPSISEAHFNALQINLHSRPPALAEAREHYRRFLELGGEPNRGVEAALNPPLENPSSGPSSIDREGQDENQDPQDATDAPPEPALPVGR